jgi:hypothetical protein
MSKSQYNSTRLSDIFVKAKATIFFGFAMEITEIKDFFLHHQCKSLLHCFFALLVSPSAKIDVWRILVSSIPLVYDGNRFLRFLY